MPLKNLSGDRARWRKVSELAPGMLLAVAADEVLARATDGVEDAVLWDDIVSIASVGREEVFDIEVAGTRNFVGNGIYAHNTYLPSATTLLTVGGAAVDAAAYIVPDEPVVVESGDATTTLSAPSDALAPGGGVDLYTLGLHDLAAVNALAAEVDANASTTAAQGTSIATLRSSLAALQGVNLDLAAVASSTLDIASTTTPLDAAQAFAQGFFGSLFAHITSWLANSGNGIGNLFAAVIHTNELCVKDAAGADVCITGDQLAAAVSGAGAAALPGVTTADTTVTSQSSTGAASTASSTPSTSTDVTPPVVTLLGSAAMNITQGAAFTDPGATATDDTDGDLTAKIVVSGAVDPATPGLYTLTYSAT
ncbi:MAG: DUF5011 domain-containing protein, partial [Patescibacteria group bacterium]|nr:DUF5011 domain-containing protein [Patescibacteria group bacterium]